MADGRYAGGWHDLPGQRNGIFRNETRARDGKMSVVDEVGILTFGQRALVDEAADIDAGKSVFLADLQRIGTARVQIVKARSALREVGIDLSIVRMNDDRHAPAAAAGNLRKAVEEELERNALSLIEPSRLRVVLRIASIENLDRRRLADIELPQRLGRWDSFGAESLKNKSASPPLVEVRRPLKRRAKPIRKREKPPADVFVEADKVVIGLEVNCDVGSRIEPRRDKFQCCKIVHCTVSGHAKNTDR